MTALPTDAPTVVHGPLSVARQHGKACIHCGAVHKELQPAGQIRLADSDEIWQIVSCGCRPNTANTTTAADDSKPEISTVPTPSSSSQPSTGLGGSQKERCSD